MSNEDRWVWFAVTLSFMAGMALSIGICRGYYRVKAIEHGAAQYNQTTGRFEWKAPK